MASPPPHASSFPNRAPAAAVGLSLDRVVDRAAPAKSLLLNKPSNRVPHPGGQLIKPGSPEDQLLHEWVSQLASMSPEELAAERAKLAAAAPAPLPSVRRLTHSQYNNTIRDLLNDHSRPAQRFPAEDYVDGFKNQLSHQGMSPLLTEAYSTAAERLAANAFRGGDRNGLIPCKPAGPKDAACRGRFVAQFGERAFRRPLLPAELKRYTELFDAQPSFEDGARAVVEAMLQSPKFLFHVEEGPNGEFADYALASRLSYLYWDTAPDEALLNTARRGELRTPAGRERAARRLIAHPNAQAALDEFFFQWLRWDRVLNVAKESRRFPEFTPEMAAAMVEETRRMLHHLVADGRDFRELLTAPYGFLSSDLATLYGFPAPAEQFGRVDFPAASGRAGLLGHASVLTATAGPLETSPTARGIFVREQLLCQHVPPPPPNVNTNLPDPSNDRPTGRRQRLAEHAENPACSSCHRLMDPIGFGLENFDAIGRWRDREAIYIYTGEDDRRRTKKVELPLKTDGEIVGLPDSAFRDAAALGRILAASPVCHECIVRQVFRYAFGRKETSADQPTINRLTARFRDSGFRFRELLAALAGTDEFARGLGNNKAVRSAAKGELPNGR